MTMRVMFLDFARRPEPLTDLYFRHHRLLSTADPASLGVAT